MCMYIFVLIIIRMRYCTNILSSIKYRQTKYQRLNAILLSFSLKVLTITNNDKMSKHIGGNSDRGVTILLITYLVTPM